MTPVAAVSPPTAMPVQQSLQLPLQMRGGLQKMSNPTYSALKLACKLHTFKHSPRYKVRIMYCCHQQLLLCLIYKIVHGLLCFLISVSTTRCFILLYLVHTLFTS